MRWRGLCVAVDGAAVLGLATPVTWATGPVGVYTPSGTKVGLQFLTALNTATVTSGANVALAVVADVIVGRFVVIWKGAKAPEP